MEREKVNLLVVGNVICKQMLMGGVKRPLIFAMPQKRIMKRREPYTETIPFRVKLALLLLLAILPLSGRACDMAVLGSPIPTTNIKLEDLRDTINSMGGNATNDIVSFFSKENIEKWSKNKPVNGVPAGLDKNFPPYDSNWYMGSQLNCGIIMTQIPTPKNVVTAPGGTYDWEYEAPYGGSESSYRLGDFRGYDRYAVTPFNTGVTSDIEVYSNSGSKTFTINPNLTGARLQFSDFLDNSSSIGSCYMYAIMYDRYGKGVDIRRSSNKVSQWASDGGAGITMDMTGKTTGTYTVYCFFCDEESLSYNFTDNEWGDYVLYSMPYSIYRNPITVDYIYQTASGISVTFMGITDGGVFPDDTDVWSEINSVDNQDSPIMCPDGHTSLWLSIYNGTESSILLSGSSAQIRYRDIDNTERIVNFSQMRGKILDEYGHETGIWSGSVTIPARSSINISVNIDLMINSDNEDKFKTQFSFYRNNIFSGSNIDDIWVYPYWT